MKWALSYQHKNFNLKDSVTFIGSYAHADIRFTSLKTVHAVVYARKSYVELFAKGMVKVNGLKIQGKTVLFQNDKVELINKGHRFVLYVEATKSVLSSMKKKPFEIVDLTSATASDEE